MKSIALFLVCFISNGLLSAQNVGIGVSAPLGTLDVARGTAGSGTALFRGTTYASHFNYGASENTYIRGGKTFSHVIINDEFPLGYVGIGTNAPLYKLHVAALGAGIVQSDGFRSIGTYTDASGGWIGTYSNHPLHFFTSNGNQQITLLTNGNVGIGTTNPQTKLHIVKNDEAMRFTGTNAYLSFYDNTTPRSYISNAGGNLVIGTFGTTHEVSIRSNGELGLVVQSDKRVTVGNLPCTISWAAFGPPRLSVFGGLGFKKASDDNIGEWHIQYEGVSDNLVFGYNGSLKAGVDDIDGEWIEVSDYRLKENFQEYPSVLDRIEKLDVLTYHYIDDQTNTRSFGLIAQNVQEYFPEIVSNSFEHLGIAYSKTGVLAIKAIQEVVDLIDEQQIIINAQQTKIEMLQLTNNVHQSSIHDLEKRLAVLEGKLPQIIE